MAATLIQKIVELLIEIVLISIHIVKLFWKTYFNSEEKDLNGQIVLITGGGNGIGREMSLQLARLGCTVLAADIRKKDAMETVKKYENTGDTSGKIISYEVDISNRTSVTNLRNAILYEHKHVDILINNAALLYSNNFGEGDEEMIEKVNNVNFLGSYWVTRAFLPSMKMRRQGHIVFISSLAALMSLQDMTIYSVTKSAITALGECLRTFLETRSEFRDIKVTTVHPSVVRTKLVKVAFKSKYPTLTPENAASQIIESIRKEYTNVTIPGNEITFKVLNLILLLPRSLLAAVNRLIDLKIVQVGNNVYKEILNCDSYEALESRLNENL